MKVGIQLQPQATTMESMRSAAKAADDLGVDSIWTWDHFYPLYGDPDAAHFEGWMTLAAFGADTSRAKIGMLVTGNTYRNPELLADMARTLDHITGGRAYLGVGAGWFERDYTEYGYEFGTARSRLTELETALERMTARLSSLNPQPIGDLPILVGGGGEKITLRLVATYANAWNTFGPPQNFAAKSAVLDRWCAEVGRDPAEIERTVALAADDGQPVEAYLEAGATHFIVMKSDPFDFAKVEELLAFRDA